jgi:radial spoke head protein 9
VVRHTPVVCTPDARSQDAVSWAQLPPVTKEMKSDCAKLSVPGGMLSGDPAKVIDLPADAPAEETEEEVPPKPVEEVTRLAVMVSMIDMECAMLPAGALVMQPGGKVEGSLTFKGLDYAKATTLKSYVFINQPKEVSVNADAVTASTDFLTPCDEMVPKGALVCKFDESMNVVSWRSLVYEGFVGYSVVGAPMHGYCYFGTGQKNADLAFMLP